MLHRSHTIPVLCAALMMSSASLAHERGGDDGAGTPAHGAAGARQAITIVERGDGKMTFSPGTLHLKRGDTMRFDVTNVGKSRHEFRVDTVGGNAEHRAMMRAMPDMQHHEGNSIALAPGAAGHLDWTFTHAGIFEFACLIPGHYEAGMHGTIIVDR